MAASRAPLIRKRPGGPECTPEGYESGSGRVRGRKLSQIRAIDRRTARSARSAGVRAADSSASQSGEKPSATAARAFRTRERRDAPVIQKLTVSSQEDGGPGIAEAIQLIRRACVDPETDTDRFLQANALNWLIGGTDAHAKNYSFLIATGNEVRLAPLYDVSSQLPYPDQIKLRVSMKIGRNYDVELVDADDWRKLAQRSGLEEGRVLTLVKQLVVALPDQVVAARDQALKEGLAETIIVPLSDLLLARVQGCVRDIQTW